MVNNYPEYAAGISYQKAEENVKHFYNAQVKVDPSDDSMSAVLTKDGEIISELPDGGGGGESDFSTATVVVTNNLVVDVFEIKDLVNIDENGLVSRAFANASETKTISVVLYKDFPTYGYYRGEGAVAVTGNIRFENGDIYVTGDGTITLGTPE